jgi:hypothetical protein
MTETASTFEAFIAAERERLSTERAALFDQQHELEQKLEAINKELAAITAYEAVKTGKPLQPTEPASQKQTRKPRDPNAPKRTRGEGGVRQRVLEMVRSRPQGMTSGDLAAFLEMDDKAGKQAIANALQALKKDGDIRQEQRRGPYTAVPKQQEAA